MRIAASSEGGSMDTVRQPLSEYVVPISPKLLIRTLVIVVTALVLVHVVLQTYHYKVHPVHWVLKDLFDLDGEDNVPSWYSGTALFMASAFLYVIAVDKQKARDAFTRHWYGLAAGFLFLSLDEVASIHEGLNSLVDDLSPGTDFPWTIPGGVAVAIVIAIYFKFFLRLREPTRRQFLISGAAYIAGAVGMEVVAHHWLRSAEPHTTDTLTYNLMSAVEESLEMYSIVYFIHSLLSYMWMQKGSVPVVVLTEPVQESAVAKRA